MKICLSAVLGIAAAAAVSAGCAAPAEEAETEVQSEDALTKKEFPCQGPYSWDQCWMMHHGYDNFRLYAGTSKYKDDRSGDDRCVVAAEIEEGKMVGMYVIGAAAASQLSESILSPGYRQFQRITELRAFSFIDSRFRVTERSSGYQIGIKFEQRAGTATAEFTLEGESFDALTSLEGRKRFNVGLLKMETFDFECHDLRRIKPEDFGMPKKP